MNQIIFNMFKDKIFEDKNFKEVSLNLLMHLRFFIKEDNILTEDIQKD